MISEVARGVLAEMESALDGCARHGRSSTQYQERVFARQIAVERQQDGRSCRTARSDNLAYVGAPRDDPGRRWAIRGLRATCVGAARALVFFLRPHRRCSRTTACAPGCRGNRSCASTAW